MPGARKPERKRPSVRRVESHWRNLRRGWKAHRLFTEGAPGQNAAPGTPCFYMGYGLFLGRGVHNAAIGNRVRYFRVGNRFHITGEQVLAQDNQIGLLAHLDRSRTIIHKSDIRPIGCIHFQHFVDTDSLVGIPGITLYIMILPGISRL